jgi:hypothetical protein
MLSYRLKGSATYQSPSFAWVWRPTSVDLNEHRQDAALDFNQLVRTLLGLALALVAACCYMKLIPSASIVVAAALSAKIASVIIGNVSSTNELI